MDGDTKRDYGGWMHAWMDRYKDKKREIIKLTLWHGVLEGLIESVIISLSYIKTKTDTEMYYQINLLVFVSSIHTCRYLISESIFISS